MYQIDAIAFVLNWTNMEFKLIALESVENDYLFHVLQFLQFMLISYAFTCYCILLYLLQSSCKCHKKMNTNWVLNAGTFVQGTTRCSDIRANPWCTIRNFTSFGSSIVHCSLCTNTDISVVQLVD